MIIFKKTGEKNMVDIFENEMCNYCKNTNCKKTFTIDSFKGVTTYKCNEYIKDNKKIIPYEKPLIITAKRTYIKFQEL